MRIVRADQKKNGGERYKVAQGAASDRPEPYFRLGISLAAVGSFDSAVKYIKQGLDLDPQWPAHGDHLDVLFGEENRLAVLSLIERVGGYFHVEPRQIQSSRRLRQVMLPRQVSMYLARQLTDLSLEQIGRYFGGRDHSTVLHACRKLQKTLGQDIVLSGAVRQLRTGLA